MESLAFTYLVLAAETGDREWQPNSLGLAAVLALALALQSGGATAEPLATFEFDPNSDYSVAQDAQLESFQFETVVKHQKPTEAASADVPTAPTVVETAAPPAAESGGRALEADETAVAPAATTSEQSEPDETGLRGFTPSEPPDFRQWAEQRLAARAQARQNAAAAPAANRVSYRYYPRPYYSRASIPDELKISPFNLVYRAYQGGLKDSEIPSYGALLSAYKAGKIAPEDLVRAGIVQGRLTAADLYDKSYLMAVENQLAALNLD